MLHEAKVLLKQYFGYDYFRDGQGKIVEHVLNGKDTLGIMPTGGGKSICYQIPSLLFPGITLVISPLISLMKDQVDALSQVGIPATYINSTLPATEVRARMDGAREGLYKLLYIAPERFDAPGFLDEIRALPVHLAAIDEAHCISQWGHDFRPSYLRIRTLLGELAEKPVVLALTATATPLVQEDIRQALGIKAEQTVLTGFKRSNLHFQVIKGQSKQPFIDQYIAQNAHESGIIYCATRKAVDHLYDRLTKQGVAVGRYHAGLSAAERDVEQERFLRDEITVMIATNAFGMGIDKSNVRYVLHAQLPKNMESYYQEAGRAGRDGLESECILLYSEQDVQVQRYLIDTTTGNEAHRNEELRKLYQMRDYCHTEGCLEAFILDYFGDKNADRCGRCSNCLDERSTTDVTKEAQMVLSCMIRMGERFGKTMIAQVLTGSMNKKLLEQRFDQLSTYGLMKDKSVKEVAEFIDFLTSAQFIGITGGQYPLLYVTPEGKDVLVGKRPVARKMVVQAAIVSSSDPLFEALRDLRKELARTENIPPYLIFSDQTLRDLCLKQPQTEEVFLTVKGVGTQKAAKYGQPFMEAISRFLAENGYETPQVVENGEISDAPKSKRNSEKSHLDSYQLYKEGLSIKEIAQARELSIQTIERHIFRCAEENMDISWEDFFSSEEEAQILAAIEEADSPYLRPIKGLLPDEISYTAIKAVQCKQKMENR